jgi:hypothetical protein
MQRMLPQMENAIDFTKQHCSVFGNCPCYVFPSIYMDSCCCPENERLLAIGYEQLQNQQPSACEQSASMWRKVQNSLQAYKTKLMWSLPYEVQSVQCVHALKGTNLLEGSATFISSVVDSCFISVM